MSVSPGNPHHQAETEWSGELQEFSGPTLSPDDPALEPRARRGRPAERQEPTRPQQQADDEPTPPAE